jgi:L-tartrate/succinate antiporter
MMGFYPLEMKPPATAGAWFRYMPFPWFFITIVLLSPVFIPLHQKFGLHPVLVSMSVITAGNSFLLGYQQPFVVMGDILTNARGWSGRHVSIAGTLYAVAVIVGILVSSICWKAMRLMPI